MKLLAKKIVKILTKRKLTISWGSFESKKSKELFIAIKEYKAISRVQKNKFMMLNKFMNNKNNKQVTNEAIVPGKNFISPILKKVMKSKLNFLIIFYNWCYNFWSYSFFFSY